MVKKLSTNVSKGLAILIITNSMTSYLKSIYIAKTISPNLDNSNQAQNTSKTM